MSDSPHTRELEHAQESGDLLTGVQQHLTHSIYTEKAGNSQATKPGPEPGPAQIIVQIPKQNCLSSK